MEDYQTAKVTYDARRKTAVSSAEALIEGSIEAMGWAFVNTKNTDTLISWVAESWTAQVIIIGVYFGLILVFIKRKDASA
jgi:hypothetical protein